MELHILGPLEVVDAGQARSIPGVRQRLILAMLVLHAGRVVSTDRLIDALWGDSPAPSARATLRTHVAQLRKALGADAATLLATEPPGYVLRIAPEQVDAVRFERWIREGHRLLVADPSGAAEWLARALALWRGDPLGDLGAEPFARAEAARLVELRWAAIEDHLAAQLALGLHAEVVSRTEALVHEEPLRERLWELLMLSLYRSGRQSEALRAFQRARRLLAEELGVDPSPRLRQLETQLLRHDEALGEERPAVMSTAPGPLPSGVVTFVLTDVEGSTRAWREHGDALPGAIRAMNAIVSDATAAHRGVCIKSRGEGDSTFSVFERPADAVAAALDLQRGVSRRGGPEAVSLRVRAAVHTGEGQVEDGDYAGIEIARAARLRDAAHGGQVVVSAATAELVAEALPPGASLLALGPHRLKDFDRPQPVYQLCHPDLPRVFPALRARSGQADLPSPLTPLVGRAHEVADIGKLLEASRLVTITGTGGCGKTRLALEVARSAADRFHDGVVLAELAAVTDPGTVLPAIAAALGVRDASGRDLMDQLCARARALELLLVIDNCEHVVAACAAVAGAILETAAGVVILATSRRRLGVPGEAAYPLAPLATPSPNDVNVVSVATSPAADLFVARAGALDPSVALTADNAPLIAQICRRLDGLPLAIELAAAAVPALGLEELSRAADRHLAAIADGGELRPPRHQTLAALVRWSCDLLSEPDRLMFARLSAFAGFDLAAAHAVCADNGVPLEVTTAGLVRLVGQSLVVPDHTATGVRYRMLETIRAHAREMLPAEDSRAVRARHLAWATDLTARAEAQLRHGDARAGLAILGPELDNLRSALEWGLSNGDPVIGLRLASLLTRFWVMRGRITEGRQWLDRARTRLDDVPEATVGRWYLAAGGLARVAGEFHAARDLLGRSVELLARSDAPRGADALFALAELERSSGDHRSADELYRQGLVVAEAEGDDHGVAAAKAGLGDIARARGDHTEALRLYEDALDRFRAGGETHSVANAHLNLAFANRGLARNEAAKRHCGEAEAVFRRLDDQSCTASALECMAEIAVAAGETGTAGALYAESLELRSRLEQRAALAVPVEGLAVERAALGHWREAIVLLSAGAALRHEGLAREPSLDLRVSAAIEEGRRRLGSAAFEMAWDVGRRHDLPEIVSMARDR